MSLDIESLLFQQVEKPKDYLMTKSINVYNDKYRVNIYCEKEEDNLTKKRICASYFVKFNNKKNKLDIICSPSGMI